MSTSEKITIAKNRLGAVNPLVRAAYVSGENMRRFIAEREAQLIFDLTTTSGANPLDPADKFTNLLGIIRSEFYIELSAVKSIWESFRLADENLAAVETIGPLLEEVARLEAELESENATRSAKQAALREAEEQALETARQAALQDPAVIIARKALEALDSPAPAKGKS